MPEQLPSLYTMITGRQMPMGRPADSPANGPIILAGKKYFIICNNSAKDEIRVPEFGDSYLVLGGEGGIRTRDTLRYTRFPSERTRPAMRPLHQPEYGFPLQGSPIIPEMNYHSPEFKWAQ